mmetsp:Transcript_3591/g.22539  ORF Transcript_3591/g.22539 Transcript_3591/m.22539 type:complete len:84 (+) Transcript_3591:1231-1482(+)
MLQAPLPKTPGVNIPQLQLPTSPLDFEVAMKRIWHKCSILFQANLCSLQPQPFIPCCKYAISFNAFYKVVIMPIPIAKEAGWY